jgi:hypothetical protein
VRAVLKRKLDVRCLAVFAELAVLESRPELVVLCQEAARGGGRLDDDALDRAVPGMSLAGRRNIVAWCKDLRICEPDGALSELGREVAAHGMAPVPEQGVYELSFVVDPLLGRRALAFERLSPRVDTRFELVSALVGAPDLNRVFTSVLDREQRFILRSFPSNHGAGACAIQVKSQRCELVWTFDFDSETESFRLEGELVAGSSRRAFATAAEVTGTDVGALADRWGAAHLATQGHWSPGARLLEVPLDRVTDDERNSFRRTVALPSVEVPGAGGFESVILEDVLLGPATAEDAQAWTDHLLLRALAADPAYRTRAMLRATLGERISRTPLASFDPVLPAHEDLCARAPSRAAFWALAAPIDLSPRPVGPEELAALSLPTAGGVS